MCGQCVRLFRRPATWPLRDSYSTSFSWFCGYCASSPEHPFIKCLSPSSLTGSPVVSHLPVHTSVSHPFILSRAHSRLSQMPTPSSHLHLLQAPAASIFSGLSYSLCSLTLRILLKVKYDFITFVPLYLCFSDLPLLTK